MAQSITQTEDGKPVVKMITFALEYFSCCSRLTTMKVSQTVFLDG